MTTQRTLVSHSNPWLMAMWVISCLVTLAGVILTGNADPERLDYDPVTASFGPPLLTGGLVLLALTLATAAICWQMQRR